MRDKCINSMIRVDHAGEYAAVCIYRGQEIALRGTAEESVVRDMKLHEEAHLAYFNSAIKKRRVRPTVFLPVWHVATVCMGYVTAIMGKEAAMACTAAVEEVICEHYDSQIKQLQLLNEDKDSETMGKIAQFREEEREHMEEALNRGAEMASGYGILSFMIKSACRLGIAVSKVL
ncbi:demethoxyubiquinone hydroxylase family protein [Anaplasma bovis]|uniref:demethoxyubiquinone hydroxylase family protein n=1 Tax=Anaplasma bovis TaxID=186733 RepID=UPI002FEEF1C1